MNLNRLLALFILMIGYAGSMFAATDFTAQPQLTTDESNPVVYAIVNYRGDIYSVRGDTLMSALQASPSLGAPSIMTTQIGRTAMWYFTDAGEDGVYIHNLEYNDCTIDGIWAIHNDLENCSPYYLLDSEWLNGKGLVISISSMINEQSCLDAANYAPSLTSGWHPSEYDWQATCWFFVRVDSDDLNASQTACESAFAENHSIPSFTYQGLIFRVTDSDSCTLTGLADNSMTTLIIPEVAINGDGVRYKVTAIEDNAFSDCSGITGDLVIPNTVISIGNRAFFNCPNFTSQTCLAIEPPTLGDEAFDEGSTIFVLRESLDQYKADEQWAKYILMAIGENLDPELTLNLSTATLNVGDSLKLIVTLKPEGYDTEIFWSSLNDEIATVNNTGVVTALSGGTTTIMVTTTDGLSATCDVVVNGPSGIGSISDGNAIKVNGRSIEAPDGSRVFNLSGIEVGDRNLAPGTYIVVAPDGRTQKVVIK